MYALKMYIYSSKGSNINQIIFQNMNFNINLLRCPLNYSRLVLSEKLTNNGRDGNEQETRKGRKHCRSFLACAPQHPMTEVNKTGHWPVTKYNFI